MDLVLEARTGRERVTIVCHGKLVGGKEADAFRHSAMLLLGGFNKLNIDLAGIHALDRGGLDSLASVLALAEKTGKEARITHANPQIAQMLRVTNLARFLDGADRSGLQRVETRAEAIA